MFKTLDFSLNFPFQLPAIFIERHNVALVLNAGDGGDVPVPGGVNLVLEIVRAASMLQMLGTVIPQQTHHHLAWRRGKKKGFFK